MIKAIQTFCRSENGSLTLSAEVLVLAPAFVAFAMGASEKITDRITGGDLWKYARAEAQVQTHIRAQDAFLAKSLPATPIGDETASLSRLDRSVAAFVETGR
jgi:hypothetical protein